MKIIQYCQHVLGIGHFFRSLEISRALSGHQVILVSGGPKIAAAPAKHVRMIHLPGLQMDGEFRGLSSTREDFALDQVKADRKQLLLSLFEKEMPDSFLIELYPFGRKAFRFELDPILEALAEKRLPGCKVICSVRDILVEKEDRARHESRVVETLNRYFDAVLVHADPTLVKIGETFERLDEISIPVIYTGYIAPSLLPDAGRKMRQRLNIGDDEILIVASAGGGNVGAPILEAVVRAFGRLQTEGRCQLKVFSGPFLERNQFDRLRGIAGNTVQVERFSEDFLSYLAAADLSVSMGGYNTTMNILACNVPALIWPFPQNREQRLRAGRLAQLGTIGMLKEDDLQPDRLAGIMAHWLCASKRSKIDFNLNGALNTARLIEQFVNHGRSG